MSTSVKKVYKCLECGASRDEAPLTSFANTMQCRKCFNRANYQNKKHMWKEYYNNEENRLKNIELAKKRYYENRHPDVLAKKIARDERREKLRQEILADDEKRKAKLDKQQNSTSVE
jgi:DNA-directed RNA polymerase subunit RPC12/RpoP